MDTGPGRASQRQKIQSAARAAPRLWESGASHAEMPGNVDAQARRFLVWGRDAFCGALHFQAPIEGWSCFVGR